MVDVSNVKRFDKSWKTAFFICMGLSLAIFLIEIFLDLGHDTERILEIIELFILLFFAADLGVNFVRAEDKKIFLKKNWFMIILLLPLLRNLRALRVTRAASLASHISTASEAGVEARNIFIGEQALMALKGMKIATHVKHGIGTRGKTVRITRFISPKADKDTAEGIKKGVDTYLRRNLGITPKYKDKDWFDLFKIEQTQQKGLISVDGEGFFSRLPQNSIVISGEKLDFSYPEKRYAKGDLKNRLVFLGTTNGLDFETDLHMDFSYLKRLRGFIAAYNTSIKDNEYERCFHPNCIHHSVMDENKLDNLAFMLHLNKDIPFCNKHQKES